MDLDEDDGQHFGIYLFHFAYSIKCIDMYFALRTHTPVRNDPRVHLRPRCCMVAPFLRSSGKYAKRSKEQTRVYYRCLWCARARSETRERFTGGVGRVMARWAPLRVRQGPKIAVRSGGRGIDAGGRDDGSERRGCRELDEDDTSRWWEIATMFFAVNTDEKVMEGRREEIERERERERERGIARPGGAHGMNVQWHVSNTRHARSCDARW